MEIQKEDFTSALMEIDVASNSTSNFETFLESQKELFHSQIDQLEKIVVTQCRLTGVNPLSQEMAAGALSINIGKRPRDLLNPKAVKYMQTVFSIKDTITKKESREISVLCGVTITQVREFFASQRSRVRKSFRLAKEKTTKADVSKTSQDQCSTNSDPSMHITDPVPLNSLDPAPLSSLDPVPLSSLNPEPLSSLNPTPLNSLNPAPLNSLNPAPLSSLEPKADGQAPFSETIPGIDVSDKNFVDNIFNLMRKEETFAGQVKLMEWILQIHNPSVLYWFLTKEGLMILAAWLSQAAVEEQTTVLYVVLKVLCHLPLNKALPLQMSAILQTVNRLRFYRTTDISNRAKVLLSRLSKQFIRSQALKKPTHTNSLNGAHKEKIQNQRTGIISNNEWQSKVDIPEDIVAFALEDSENCRNSEPPQALKLLTSSADDSSKKKPQTKERRKVLLVEQPGRNNTGRSLQGSRPATSNHSRPMSTDDIQKAKMRAMFMQSKYGKNVASSNENPPKRIELPKRSPAFRANHLASAPKSPIRPEIEEITTHAVVAQETSPTPPEAPVETKLGSVPEALPETQLIPVPQEPSLELEMLKRVQMSWQTPPEIRINPLWRFGTGEDSKEVEIQNRRTQREKETIYTRIQDIPPNPKEPWDREMDYDDSLTPEIPTEQPPEADANVADTVEEPSAPSPPRNNEIIADTSGSSSNTVPDSMGSESLPEPDLELLAVLLKNPELVFALTSGQGSNLSSADTVKLLDMIKTNGINLSGVSNGVGDNNVGNTEVATSLPFNNVGNTEVVTSLPFNNVGNTEVVTSLPSPTPPSEPRMNRWRSEVGNNGFPQPSPVSVREAAVFSVAATTPVVPLSGNLSATTHLVQPQILTSTSNFLPQLPATVAPPTHYSQVVHPESLATGMNSSYGLPEQQYTPINQVQPTSSPLRQNSYAAGLSLLQQQGAQPTTSPLRQNNYAAGLSLLQQQGSQPTSSPLRQINYAAGLSLLQQQGAQPTSSPLRQNNYTAGVSLLQQQGPVSYEQIYNVAPSPISVVMNPPKLAPLPLPTPQRQQSPHLSDTHMLQPSQPTWKWTNVSDTRQNGYDGSVSNYVQTNRMNGYEGSVSNHVQTTRMNGYEGSVSNHVQTTRLNGYEGLVPNQAENTRQNGYDASVSNFRLQYNQNNYPGDSLQPQFLPGSTWDRTELMDDAELESWSPDRSLEYRSGFSSGEPIRDSGGRSTRPDWSRRRDSGYRDNRHGNKRWRGRRN